MKNSRDLALGLLATSLLIVCSSGMLLAGAQGDEHAGYQGIPVRSGLNRGLIHPDELPISARYPGLPRRENEADAHQIASAAQSQNDHNSSEHDRRAYAGIPQRSTLNITQIEPVDSPNTTNADRSGYSGIPQQIVQGHVVQRGKGLKTKPASGLVQSK